RGPFQARAHPGEPEGWVSQRETSDLELDSTLGRPRQQLASNERADREGSPEQEYAESGAGDQNPLTQGARPYNEGRGDARLGADQRRLPGLTSQRPMV